MKYVTAFLISILFTHFVLAQKPKGVAFTTFESLSNSNKIIFCLDVPKKYKKIKTQGDTHYGFEVKVIYYADSSIIYIGNNVHEGSILNFQNRMRGGYASFAKKSSLDTIYMTGIQSNGNFWRENILGNVVIGYLNVPSNKKEVYDRALATLRRKK
jgi:hypothetical protein